MLDRTHFEALPERASVTVRLRGDCDADDVPAIHEAVAALGAGPSTPVVLDLGEVTYLGSSGLGALVEIHSTYPAMQLRDVPDNVRRLLDLTGLTAAFDGDDS